MNIWAKVVNWFDLTRPQLEEEGVLQENVYNMDETGVMVSVIGSSKHLVSKVSDALLVNLIKFVLSEIL
jgi:hypothetical protein